MSRPIWPSSSIASCSRRVTHQARQASTATRSAPPAHAPQLARLESKALLRLDGPDSLNLLQGLTTANALLLKEQEAPVYSAILNAPGRVILDVFIHRLQGANGKESFIVEHDQSLTGQLVQHFKRHILRSKVKLSSASEDFGVFAAWSPLHTLDLSASDLSKCQGFQDPRLESMGYRFLAPRSATPLSDAVEVREAAYKLHRTRLGVPEGPQDIPPGVALPMESNIDYMGGIDLKKGCYVGQELTSRTHHTGVIRKRIVPVHFFKEAEDPPTSLLPVAFDAPQPAETAPSALPPPQADIRPFHSSVSKPRPSGKMGSSIWCTSLGQEASQVGLGLALVRLEQMSPDAGGGVFKVGDEGWLAKAFEVDWWARKAESIQSGKQR